MKGLGRILGRYVGAAIGVGVFLLMLNFAAFIAFLVYSSQSAPEIKDRVSVIAEGIRQQADGGFSVSEEARTALDERYVWAMQLDDDGNVIWGDRMPEDLPLLNGVRFLRTGLLLGELKKKRFEPSQALAMNLKKNEYKKCIDLPVSDGRVIKYLKGETLDVSDLAASTEKGWYLFCVDGYPLGFGKLAGQTLKNKYLPGWRWQSS